MLHRVLNIGHWVIDFLFATKDYDMDGVLACLYDAGATEKTMDYAKELMLDSEDNEGFTYSNDKKKRGVVVIGPVSSGDEFIDTLVHEIRHVADAIANSIGYKLDGEIPAYISGDAARSLAEVICRLGCRE